MEPGRRKSPVSAKDLDGLIFRDESEVISGLRLQAIESRFYFSTLVAKEFFFESFWSNLSVRLRQSVLEPENSPLTSRIDEASDHCFRSPDAMSMTRPCLRRRRHQDFT